MAEDTEQDQLFKELVSSLSPADVSAIKSAVSALTTKARSENEAPPLIPKRRGR